MKAEIISIGTEILLGEITDTNAPYLASELPLLGIDLYWITQVGDNEGRLLDALQRACGRSEIIITTGGLGPTEDDITREAIAKLTGEKMNIDLKLEDWLKNLFHQLGYEMPESNLKQAYLIPSAKAIPNRRGTAPGWWVEYQAVTIIAMPGPPGEMTQMWNNEVKPKLKERLTGEIILSRTIKLMGLGEAKVDELARPFLSCINPTLAVYAKQDGIHLRLTGKGKNSTDIKKSIAQTETRLENIFGKAIWGYDEDTLEVLIGTLLKKHALSLATMESCTGGLLASTITDVPGSSDYFKGSIVAYSLQAKSSFEVDSKLLVQHGTVHPEVAKSMADTARLRFRADIGIGITGVAGPSELEKKPVGTVHIAISSESRKDVLSVQFPPRRLEVKRRAVFTALFRLKQFLHNYT